ncbi:49L [Xanthomonas phage Xp10]|uniref:49L n=1 Tax=Xanthomonas phage Xp10 TaxID=2907956 RepID=Q7Y5G7_9CAUD|nr:HNH endonuclease [Xanthomonas phage Xp10]AAP58717.1 49L [Xanthomonas phage Xp10]
MSKNNELSFEEVDQLLAYDPETGLLRWKLSRQGPAKAGSVAGTPHIQGYLQVRVHGKDYRAHRLAWLLHTGSWPSQHLDHISGQRDDNRFSNLRECNKSENGQNRGMSSNNTSGVQGVCWHKQTKKWRARIMVQGKHISLGYFTTIEEAAAARAAAKQQYHTFQPVERNECVAI